MAVADFVAPRFEIGRVIRRVFSVTGNNVVTFVLLALVPGLAWAAIGLVAASLKNGGTPPFNSLALIGALGLLYFVSGLILQGAVVHGAVASLNGRRASVGACLSTGIKYAVPLFLLGLLAGLGIVAGMILLLIPGLMLAIMWVAAGPACIVEHTGVLGAFSRSRELTRGHRWAIFGLYIVLIILVFIIAMVVGALTVAFTGVPGSLTGSADAATPAFAEMASSALSTMITNILGSVLSASIYYELRQIKEGIGPEALASVFD